MKAKIVGFGLGLQATGMTRKGLRLGTLLATPVTFYFRNEPVFSTTPSRLPLTGLVLAETIPLTEADLEAPVPFRFTIPADADVNPEHVRAIVRLKVTTDDPSVIDVTVAVPVERA